MKRLLTILYILSVCASLSAQHLTLEECRQSALRHNIKVQKQLLETDNAQLQRKEAFTKFFPSLSAIGAAIQFDKPQVQMDMTAMVGQPVMLEMLKNGVIGAVNVQWPIFVGGQIVNGNRLAQVGYDIKQLLLVQTQNEVSLTTEQYFWQVVALQQKLTTLQTQEQLLFSIVRDAQNAVDAGLATRNDLLQAQLQQNKVQSGILTLENNLQLCKMLLAQYCGLWAPEDSLYDPKRITLSALIDPTSEVSSPAELLVDHATALSATPEFALANQGVRAQRLQYKMEVGAHLPTIAIGGSYSYTNLARNDMGFGENNKNTMLMYAMVNIPLSDWWGGSLAMRRKKNAVRAAELDRQEASQMLIVRMESAYANLNTAYQQMGVARKSIEQAQENLRLEQDLYHAGTTIMSDLLKAQSSYQQANDDFVDAWITYQEKRLEYLQATGR